MTSYRVLIVGDEFESGKEMARALASAGYQVEGPVPPEKVALQRAAEHSPDLVIIDGTTKGETDRTATVAHVPSHSDAAIVYVIDPSIPDPPERAKSTEPYGYLTKPVSEDELLRVAEMALFRHRTEKRLRESEERFRLLYERAPLAYQSLDEDGRFLQVNQTWIETLGYSQEEVIGKWFGEFLAPAYRDRFKMNFPRFKAAGAIHGIEFEMVRKDGSPVTVSFNGRIGCDEEGRFKQTHCIFHDITELNRSRKALEESEERFRRMVETAVEGIWSMDQEFRTTFVNRRMADMLGYSVNEVIGRPVQSFMFDEDLQDHAEKMERRRQGEAQSYERRYRRKDGGTVWTIVSATPLLDSSGEFAGSFAMFTDITDRKQTEKSLQESQERLQTIFDTSPAAIFLVSPEGRITLANRRMGDLFSRPHDNLAGMPYVELIHPEQRNTGHSKMKSLMAGEIDHVSLERRYVTADGKEFLGHLSGRRLLDPDGRLEGLVGIITDITDRRRAGEALKESEERYRTLFERAGDGIIVVDIEGDSAGRIVSANRVAAEMHGYEIDEFLGLRMSELDAPEEARRMAELFARVREGEVLKTEHYHKKKDGSIVPIELSAGLLEMRSHKYSLSINRDISDRKRAEAERMLLATAVEQAAESVEITDSEGNVVYVNPAFERTTGYSRSEIVGRKPGLLASGRHDESVYRRMWQTIRAGQTWSGNLINKKKDGTLFEEEVAISPVKDNSGVILNFVAVKRDVTNEILLRKQLLEAQKMEAVGTLAGGIAHDFNNLLQVINGFAEMALFDVKEGQPGWSELKEILRAARSAAELTEGLLTFSRKVESKLRRVNLNQEVRNVERILARTLPKMIDIRLNLSETLEAVSADPAQLQQVIMNLAVNARDAMPRGGRLTIDTGNVTLDEEYCKTHLETVPGRYVVLCISDTGIGMDEETRRHVFEPFFTTKQMGRGTGLGLSIAFGIVRSHGGSILCYSEPGQGTTFKIYLPALRPAPEVEKAGELRSMIGGSEIILLVDDEDSVRELASRLLTKFGYTVLTARDGIDALEVFSRHGDRIDLVVLDLIMPKMGGRDCLREIMKTAPRTRVIIASGYSANGQIDLAMEDGARACVRKPYEARQLLDAVRKALDGEYC